ncbi:MAG TPA: hypothetical protein VFS09_10230 [Candidatus Eisenbacteria bacterium]|nr:hypothetical protein [Candidatus Eisenbacteria bacterium]
MAQHATLTLERWSRFTLDQQILMIANEMNRGSKFLGPDDQLRRRNAYERALALVDLTIGVNSARGLRYELLRWRDLLAALYNGAAWLPEAHEAALRALLRFTPEASRQIPHVFAGDGE